MTQVEANRRNGNGAALSVILVVGGQRRRAAHALRSLLEQSAIDRMEILLFDLGPESSRVLPGSDHPHVKVTRSSPADLLMSARLRGIYAAKAPVICFIEEHCEMLPGWADAVIAAHREPWAAVGTDFVNANPDAGTSNKAFRMNYGLYGRPPAPRGPVSVLTGQNCAFKRDVLLKYEPGLELLLNGDLVLQWKMQQDGYRFFCETEVKIAHLSENTFRSHATGAFYWNWCFSHVRAQTFGWSPLRRALWILLAPLIPWVRLMRLCVRGIAGDFPRLQFLRDIPFIIGVGYWSAAGQVAGLLNPFDRGIRKFSHFEMNEPRASRADDRYLCNARETSRARGKRALRGTPLS